MKRHLLDLLHVLLHYIWHKSQNTLSCYNSKTTTAATPATSPKLICLPVLGSRSNVACVPGGMLSHHHDYSCYTCHTIPPTTTHTPQQMLHLKTTTVDTPTLIQQLHHPNIHTSPPTPPQPLHLQYHPIWYTSHTTTAASHPRPHHLMNLPNQSSNYPSHINTGTHYHKGSTPLHLLHFQHHTVFHISNTHNCFPSIISPGTLIFSPHISRDPDFLLSYLQGLWPLPPYLQGPWLLPLLLPLWPQVGAEDLEVGHMIHNTGSIKASINTFEKCKVWSI